jgi:hypothetical protein
VPLVVVTGPPCAGKSTYILERAGPQDIVIDYDRLAVALAGEGADSHEHPAHLRQVAFRAWCAVVNEALKQSAEAQVWLIHSKPNARAMDDYRRHKADIVVLDPGRRVVEERCRESRPSMMPVIGRWYGESHAESSPARRSRQW